MTKHEDLVEADRLSSSTFKVFRGMLDFHLHHTMSSAITWVSDAGYTYELAVNTCSMGITSVCGIVS